MTELSRNIDIIEHKQNLISYFNLNVEIDCSNLRPKHKNDTFLKSKKEIIERNSITVLINSLNENKKENFLTPNEVEELLNIYTNDYLEDLNKAY